MKTTRPAATDQLTLLSRLKKLVIIAVFSDDELMQQLVLKGGNLLDIVFGISSRGSMDLDFSIEGTLNAPELLQARISKALGDTLVEEGFVAFDISVCEVPPGMTADMRDFWGGYRIEFKIIEKNAFAEFSGDAQLLRKRAQPIGSRGSPKFKIDISRHEYCGDKQKTLLDGYTIFTYSPEMVVAEKLRALCQQMPEYTPVAKNHPRARARDFLDIFELADRFRITFGDDSFRQLVRKVFEIKRVPVRLIERISDFRDYHRPDFAAVRDTVKPGVQLQGFDYYFDYVVDACRSLEPLWHI